MRELQGAGEGKHERDVIVRGEWYHSTVGVGDGAPGLGRKGGDAACQRRVVVDVEFEEVEERVRDGGDCAIYVCRRKVVSEVRRGGSEMVPFSTPKGSSRGRSVSLQTGKGTYWSWPWESVIWGTVLRWHVYGSMGLLVKPLKENYISK